MRWENSIFTCLTLSLILGRLSSLASRKIKGRCPRRTILVNEQSGYIESPGFPNTYLSKQRCIWRIQVEPGFLVYLHFHSTFNVPRSANRRCNKDFVLVSSRRQSFRTSDALAVGSHSIAFCGTRRPSNVTSYSTEIWLRFHSDKGGKGKGFRVYFTALDIDECKQANGSCERRCVNTPGSYRCACQDGYELTADRKHCSEILRTIVNFSRRKYQKTITARTSPGTKLVRVRATSRRSDRPLQYAILTVNTRVQSRRRALFAIDRKTGVITLRRRPTAGLYRLHVQARLNDVSYSRAYVNIRVRPRKKKPPQKRGFRFSRPHYSVIIPVTILKGQKILHLTVYKPKNLQNATVRYRLRSKSTYFKLNSKTGKLIVAKKLQLNNTTTIVIRIRAFTRGGVSRVAEASVSIAIVPEFIGNQFVESSLRAINNESTSTKPRGGRNRSDVGRGMAEFQLHRMFRKASPEARRISKADLKFNKVIKEIKLEVARRVLGRDARSRTDLVSVRLGPSSLTSASKLSDIIRNLNCSQPKANCSDNVFNVRFRTFDGACNNLDNPLWGAALAPFTRMLESVYYDDNRLSDPVGFPDQPFAPPMPSPHLVSREFIVHRQRATKSSNNYAHMLMQWGQFLDHDIAFTAESEGAEKCILPNCDNSPADYEPPCFPIMYPGNDECTMFTRSAATCQSDDSNVTPREQLNTVSSYIDGSQIYGSSKTTADNLRDFISLRGYLRTSHPDFLPYIKSTLKPPLNLCQIFGGCFDAGDFRVNEQIALVSMHTLWMREHNRIARKLHSSNRHWDDTKIFLEARKIVGAELQHITYSEYLPKILGQNGLPGYTGYHNVNPTISNVFAAAAFRFGHSTVRPSFSKLNSNFDPISPDIPLIDAFFNNKLVQKDGIEPILLGLLANVSQNVDREIADVLTKHLFQQPESEHGFDLAALNIQRGRDHGIPGYGVWRRECNLTHAEIFEETRDEIKEAEARRILDALYDGSVENADLWVSGLAENPVKGAIVGPTFLCILQEQFRRLRDGDRFWYENTGVFTKDQLSEIKKVTLSRVLCDNVVGIVSVQRDAFRAPMLRDRRVACSQIPSVNLREWDEKQPSPGKPDPTVQPPTVWSDWFYTVRTSTGSWAVSLGKQVCLHSVVDIQCELADGSPWQQSGQVIHCQPLVGVYCRNSEQREQRGYPRLCRDFRFRFACSDIPRPVPTQPSVSPIQGSPRQAVLKCSERYPRDVPFTFQAIDSITIDRPFTSTAHSEFLFAGKSNSELKKRTLLKFNTKKISRRVIVHSAFLYLYLVDIERGTGLKEDEIPPNNLEAYQIISSNWKAENTTSVIPWHENHMGIGTDVDARH